MMYILLFTGLSIHSQQEAAATAVGAIAENSNHASVKDLIVHAQRCLSELGYNFDLNTILASNWITQESSSKGLSFRRYKHDVSFCAV